MESNDDGHSNCGMGKVPANLSHLLDELDREQNNLDQQVQKLEQEKNSMEPKLAALRKQSLGLRDELESLQRENHFLEKDIKSLTLKSKSLAGEPGSEEQGSALDRMIAYNEDIRTKTECHAVTKSRLTEFWKEAQPQWDRFIQEVCAAEDEAYGGLQKIEDMKERLRNKIEMFRKEEGSLDDLNSVIEAKKNELNEVIDKNLKVVHFLIGGGVPLSHHHPDV